MTSLWKDLLFLHGHLVRKEDLAWQDDTRIRHAPRKDDRSLRTLVACCTNVWPRLAGPR